MMPHAVKVIHFGKKKNSTNPVYNMDLASLPNLFSSVFPDFGHWDKHKACSFLSGSSDYSLSLYAAVSISLKLLFRFLF